MRRSSLSRRGIVQGTLAQRGIPVIFVESFSDGEIVQRAVAQMGWHRNLAILQDCQSHQGRLRFLNGRFEVKI